MNTEVKSAARVLDLLEYLAGCSEPVKLKEIVAALGFPKSSAHALAQTLVSRGYAIQDATERYVLVHASRHQSASRALEARLLSAAHPIMEQLRDETGETVMLAVLTVRGDCRRIAKCVSRQAVRYDIELDGLSDSYCSATGRVLLAHWDPALTDGYFARAHLVPRTPKAVTDPGTIRGMFETIRAEGIAVSDEEHVTGSTGLAAPIWGREGKVIAALNLGVVTLRYHARANELAELLRNGARRISERLGHKSGSNPAILTTVPRPPRALSDG